MSSNTARPAIHPKATGVAPQPGSRFTTETEAGVVITRVLLEEGEAEVTALPSVPGASRPAVFCPFCGRQGVYRKSRTNAAYTEHFAHQGHESCAESDLSQALHMRAIQELRAWLASLRQRRVGLQIVGPCRRCKAEKHWTVLSVEDWDEEVVEQRLATPDGYRVPDLNLRKNGTLVAVLEVAHTSLVFGQREQDLRSLGVPCLEIDARQILEGLPATGILADIRSAWNLESAPRRLHVCPSCRVPSPAFRRALTLCEASERLRGFLDHNAAYARFLDCGTHRTTLGDLEAAVRLPEALRNRGEQTAMGIADRSPNDPCALKELVRDVLGWSDWGLWERATIGDILENPFEAVLSVAKRAGGSRDVGLRRRTYLRACQIWTWTGGTDVCHRVDMALAAVQSDAIAQSHTAMLTGALLGAVLRFDRDSRVGSHAMGISPLHLDQVRRRAWDLCPSQAAQPGLEFVQHADRGLSLFGFPDALGPLRSALQITRRWRCTPFCAPLSTVDTPNSLCLSEGQDKAMRMATRNAFGLVTGGPGTGKTTLLRGLVHRSGGQWTVLAPTWKALVRLETSLADLDRQPHIQLRFQTVAKFIKETEGTVPDGSRNKGASPNQARGRRVVVDEAGMLDTAAFSRLVMGARHAMQLLLVGDPNQLPSVGPGAVLRDLQMLPTIPHVRLDVVHRASQATGIPQLAREILQGRCRETGPGVFVRESTGSDLARNAVSRALKALQHRSLRQVMVLVPTNALREQVNKAMQRRVNGSGKQLSNGLRTGDPVLLRLHSGDYRRGELGVVTGIHDSGRIIVAFGPAGDTFESPVCASKLDLAYCLTIHKSQGSEWDSVVVALPRCGHPDFLSRQMLYTAVTRAKKDVSILGPRSVVEAAAMCDTAGRRITLLPALARDLEREASHFRRPTGLAS